VVAGSVNACNPDNLDNLKKLLNNEIIFKLAKKEQVDRKLRELYGDGKELTLPEPLPPEHSEPAQPLKIRTPVKLIALEERVKELEDRVKKLEQLTLSFRTYDSIPDRY